MAERPILFSAPMVRALLTCTKSQTRRAIMPQPETQHDGEPYWHVGGYRVWGYRPPAAVPLRAGGNPLPCPYGAAGDRLWVRESFSGARAYETRGYALKDYGNKLWYWADGNPRSGDWTKPKPSIHMPRVLSRITLEVTGVRVERLQDISRGDAMAEGCPFANMAAGPDPRDWYRDLWNEINGPGAWDANPWVWVVSFKVSRP